MKVTYAIAIILLSLTLCRAQVNNSPEQAPDEAFTQQLVQLLTGLKKNPWAGWKSGTEVVRRYLGNNDPALKPYNYVQPDLVFQVLETDRLIAVTQVVNGKPHRQQHLVKDQKESEELRFDTDVAKAAGLKIDGFTLAILFREWPSLIVNDGPGFPAMKEWRLASHPTLLLRKESGSTTSEVASARVTKKIGGREFQCVKTIGKMNIYVDGLMDVVTTQYLSPDMPGFVVEEVKEFYKVDKIKNERVLNMTIHQLVIVLKLP